MSFILDALKKSEAERQRQAGPALLEMRVVRPARRWPVWGAVILGLLLVNGAVLTWLALRKPAATLAPAIASNTAPVAVAPPSATPTVAAPPDNNLSAANPAQPVPVNNAASGPAAVPGDGVNVDESSGAGNPADVAPAQPASPYGATSEPPSYETMNANLPDLQLNLHVFADAPAARYALINMRKVHEGDVTPEGARVLRITPTGVVLDYRGTQFVLGK